VDLVGNVYVADFDDTVWKITPEGKRTVFATGFYGASGNAIDAAGNLLQSSYYGNYITKVDRQGRAVPFATSGLKGPVGLAIDAQSGEVYVANCGGNTISKVGVDGKANTFARSDLFKCPNGLAFDGSGNLYTVNFRNNHMLKIGPNGAVSLFATVSPGGLGHLCFKKDRFYVTAFESHEIYEVKLDGSARLLLGDGERGVRDGSGAAVRLSFPNGIGCDPWLPKLYINEYLNASEDGLPRRTIVREIDLQPGG
jgi:DNA-binding beta-propeller fold protein YncE